MALKPDMASLATGSVNFPTRVYDNPPDFVEWLAAEMREKGIKPEIEAFDLSMIFQAANMQTAGLTRGALHVQFVMGIRNAMPVVRLDRHTLAPSNAALVREVVALCERAGRPVATCAEARRLLGLPAGVPAA